MADSDIGTAADGRIALEPLFQQLLAWWGRHCRAGAIPDRRAIDAVEIGTAALPYLVLTDLVGADDCRYRLVGTEVVRWLGADPTGRLLSEALHPEHGAYIASLLATVRAKRRPVWASSLLRRGNGENLETRRLFLPFTRGGEEVEVVLGIQSFRFPGSDVIPPRVEVVGGATIEELQRQVLAAAA